MEYSVAEAFGLCEPDGRDACHHGQRQAALDEREFDEVFRTHATSGGGRGAKVRDARP